MSFKQHLEQMSFDDLVPLWNEWCAQYGQDDTIYDSIEEFAELYGEDGVELARKVFFGSVDNWYDKVYLDGYGNFQSCYSVESSPIDIDALVDFMKEENHPDYVSWCDEQPSFAEWLDENVGDARLRALWEKFCPHDEGDELDVDAIADALDGTPHELYYQWYNETH